MKTLLGSFIDRWHDRWNVQILVIASLHLSVDWHTYIYELSCVYIFTGKRTMTYPIIIIIYWYMSYFVSDHKKFLSLITTFLLTWCLHVLCAVQPSDVIGHKESVSFHPIVWLARKTICEIIGHEKVVSTLQRFLIRTLEFPKCHVIWDLVAN